MNFAWDSTKEIVNERKHGVNFSEARAAFYDAKRVIAHDDAHSQARTALLLYWENRAWNHDGSFYASR